MKQCSVCSNPIPKGKFCKKCVVQRRLDLQRARRATSEVAHEYYKKRIAKERAILSLHLRPCQASVDELNKNFPWLRKADHQWG